jgi:deazaflavin-dependent oxidoreductase (nitroreductase family)
MSLTGQFLRFHEAVYKGSDGRIGHNMIGVPCLLLRTTGRKSGQTRTNSLVYARDGDDYIVVGSVGGGPNNPGWIHNLRANPDAEIQIGRKRMNVRARELGKDDADYARLWKIVNDGNRGRYDEYQTKTSRVIPVVALTPV